LMQSAAATIGEISQPVAGSTARGIVTLADFVRGCGFGGDVTTAGSLLCLAALAFRSLRHFAKSRSKWEKLPE